MIEILFLMARLDFDLRHAAFVHAPRTELEKVTTQECFRGEVRHVDLSANELDTDLAAFDVVTMFEESNVEVLVFTRRFRIVRGKNASQVATVEWRRRNKDGVGPMVGRRFLTIRHYIESGDGRNNEATLEQQRAQGYQMLSPEQEAIATSSASWVLAAVRGCSLDRHEMRLPRWKWHRPETERRFFSFGGA